MAVTAIFGTEKKSGKDWENCGGDASYCEEYFFANGEYDAFDGYLEDKFAKTLEDGVDVGETIDDVYEAIYLAIYDEELPVDGASNP